MASRTLHSQQPLPVALKLKLQCKTVTPATPVQAHRLVFQELQGYLSPLQYLQAELVELEEAALEAAVQVGAALEEVVALAIRPTQSLVQASILEMLEPLPWLEPLLLRPAAGTRRATVLLEISLSSAY